MKSFISKIFRKFFPFRNEDIPSFLLHSLFHQGTFLPFTTSSLKFRSLACVCNDLVVNNRQEYLEFGSGISTIIVARLIKKNQLKTKITTVEEDLGWITIIKKIIEDEGLEDLVTFIHAPTEKSEEIDNAFGYSASLVKTHFSKGNKYDCILIDGPAAWEPHKKNSRICNAILLNENLASNYSIFVDNANRPGELTLLDQLAKNAHVKPLHIDATFAVLIKGTHYNFII